MATSPETEETKRICLFKLTPFILDTSIDSDNVESVVEFGFEIEMGRESHDLTRALDR